MKTKTKDILISIQDNMFKLLERQDDIENLKQEIKRLEIRQDYYEEREKRIIKDVLIELKGNQIDTAIERIKNSL